LILKDISKVRGEHAFHEDRMGMEMAIPRRQENNQTRKRFECRRRTFHEERNGKIHRKSEGIHTRGEGSF
jgi:hypothetical protein